MQVAKWGNSLAVRIPADVARALGIKEGDEVQLHSLGKGELGLLLDRQLREAIVERMKRFAGRLPTGYKFDRDDANARDPAD